MTGDIIQWLSPDFFSQALPFQTYPVVSQQALQLVAVPLSHVPPPAQLQLGQELLQGGGAVAVPAGWVTRAPLHDLLLQDLLNPMERETVNVFGLVWDCSRTWHSVYLPVLKLCCSCFVCAPIHQLLRLKKSRFRRNYKNDHWTYNKIIQKCWTLTCMLDSPGWEKDREKNGFHKLAFVMSKIIVIGDVYSWMLNHT